MGIEMIEWLNQWLQTDDTKIIYLLTAILIANVIDTILGFIIAQFSPKIQFSSSKAKLGILIKLIIFIVLVFAIPLSLLIPYNVGIGALFVLYTGVLISEIRSILAHLRLAGDEKNTNLLETFINTIFKNGKDEK